MVLLSALLLPIALSPLVYLAAKRMKGIGGWIAFAVLSYSTLALLYAAANSPAGTYVENYPWSPIGTFGLLADGLSLPFAAIVLILSTAISVYSIPYMEHRISEEGLSGEKSGGRLGLYFALYLLYAAGMLGTVLSTNLIQFYLFFELMLIPSAFLIFEYGYGDRHRIALMYFMWTHVGALILLAGLLTLGLTAGSFDLLAIRESAVPGPLRVWVAAAFAMGLGVKLAALGLHVWLPHAHAEAPTPVSALLSPAMIGIGGYALLRLVASLLPSAYHLATGALALWGVATMIYGGLMALAQSDIKRLLAYSSISQMGYIIFGVSTAQSLGLAGSVLQYVSHGTGKAILFMVAGTIILQAHGLRNIDAMGGLARRLPITATAAMIGFLTIFGAPPLNGFQAEWMLFYGAFASPLASGFLRGLALASAALASTLLTAGYTLWTMKRVFFGPLPESLREVKEAPATVIIPLLFLALLSLVLGVYPTIINERLFPVVKAIAGG